MVYNFGNLNRYAEGMIYGQQKNFLQATRIYRTLGRHLTSS